MLFIVICDSINHTAVMGGSISYYDYFYTQFSLCDQIYQRFASSPKFCNNWNSNIAANKGPTIEELRQQGLDKATKSMMKESGQLFGKLKKLTCLVSQYFSLYHFDSIFNSYYNFIDISWNISVISLFIIRLQTLAGRKYEKGN